MLVSVRWISTKFIYMSGIWLDKRALEESALTPAEKSIHSTNTNHVNNGRAIIEGKKARYISKRLSVCFHDNSRSNQQRCEDRKQLGEKADVDQTRWNDESIPKVWERIRVRPFLLPGRDTNLCSSFFRRVISLHSWISSILHTRKQLLMKHALSSQRKELSHHFPLLSSAAIPLRETSLSFKFPVSLCEVGSFWVICHALRCHFVFC